MASTQTTPHDSQCHCGHLQQDHSENSFFYKHNRHESLGSAPQTPNHLYESQRTFGHHSWSNNAAQNIGLGIDFGFRPKSKELEGLLSGIASYERAVGRAFLAQRSSALPSPDIFVEDFGSSDQGQHLIDSSQNFPGNRSSSIESELSLQTTNFEFFPQTPAVPQNIKSLPSPLLRRHSEYVTSNLTHNHHSLESINTQLLTPTTMYSPEQDFRDKLDSLEYARLQTPIMNHIQPHDTHLELGDAVLFNPPNSCATENLVTQSPPSDLICEQNQPDSVELLSTRSASPSAAIPRPNKTRGWTTEADDCIRQEVAAQRKSSNGPIQWSKIATKVGDRTGVQCQARWAEVLDQSICKGRWSSNEDRLLRTGSRKYGSCWSKISEVVRTRTQRQCRSRWLQMNSAMQSPPDSS